MSKTAPDPVETWAPIFLYFAGTTEPKFKKEQVLDPKFALVGTYCKLCDAHFSGSGDEHMRAHKKELNAWLARRRREAAAKSKKGLAAWRREQEMQARAAADVVIAHPEQYEDEED